MKIQIFLAITAAISVTACSRDMTDGEIAYGQQVFTRDLDFEVVRFSGNERNAQRKATRQLESEAEQLAGTQPKDAGSEKLLSILPSLFGADAMAIANTVYYDSDVYSPDFSKSAYDSDRWLMAHELTHVWQWQNRAKTGYSFTKVVSEHLKYGDAVYDYKLVNGKKFTEYRFEQQGEIVECYMKLRQLSPDSPLTIRHEKLIRAEFPLDSVVEIVGSPSSDEVSIRPEAKSETCGA